MDFFNLRSPTSASKTQKYGQKIAAVLTSSLPLAADETPRRAPLLHQELFIEGGAAGGGLPEQQDLRGIRQYFCKRPSYSPLPICTHRQEILQTIKENPVTVITAPTGSGKSTRVPQYIMDDEYYKEQRHFKIVVTQPRRVAAVALARRVLSERALDPIDYTSEGQGTLVGYQIGMDKQVNDDTRLVYMTTGVLLRKLCQAGNLNEFTHIILDEVHERNKETDFLLLLVKKLLCSVSKFVKVVVMSATVNAETFSKYFSMLVGGIPRPCPTLEIREQFHKVIVSYLESVERGPEPSISEEIYQVAVAMIESFDDLDQMDASSDDKGSVLVFLPGIYEIEACTKHLTRESSESYDIIPLHSSIPRTSQMRVFSAPQPGRRKVILSTNIAESSITVPDIRYVIDFCLTKELVCDESTGMTSLRCTWAPRSSLDQRKGRAGRVADGRCYRLIPRSALAHLPEFTKPEMQRCSLEHIILWCKVLNIGDPQHMLSLALDPPDLTKLYQSTLLLEEAGALIRPDRPNEPFSGQITFLGQVMGVLPLDIRLARLIMFGFAFNCFTECIVIAACLALPGFLEVPYSSSQDKMRSYVGRMRKAAGTFSDPIMMLHVYNAWYDAHSRGIHQSKEFCKSNFIEFSRIQDVASLVHELNSVIHRFNIPAESMETRRESYSDSSYILKLKLALAASNYPNFFVKAKEAVHEENCLQMFGSRSAADTVMFTGMNIYVSSDDELQRQFIGDVNKFFRQGFCDPVKSLSLEGARMYVKFENPAERNVCKSVYYALKMKKLGFGLTLSENYNNCMNMENSIPQAKRTIPIIKEVVVIRVTHVTSPTKFHVQFIDNPLRSEWELTQNLLQELPRERIPYTKLTPKSYAATFYDDEIMLYRVRMEHSRNEQMKVYYLDYGNYKDVPFNQLFWVPDDLLQTPFQAIECSVENLAPATKSLDDLVSGGWPAESCSYVRELLLDGNFTARVYYMLNGVVHLDITAGEETLKEVLMRRGIAYEPEPDHRVKLARTTTNVLGIRLDTAFSVRDDGYEAPYVHPNFTSSQVHLSGGCSPYEVSHRPLCQAFQNKSVVVDPSSVNSVLLHHNTGQHHLELLTACSVALAGDRVQLRGSTAHDPLPGLPEILVLMFAPAVQLHCTAGKLHYTGCTAGLGKAEGAAIWPEHDLNVKFHVRIDHDDLVNINKLRMYVSDLLQGDEDNPNAIHLTHAPIRQLQRKIWRLVTVLLQKRRAPLAPCEYVEFGWAPPRGTENVLLPGYRDFDVMKPLEVLRTIHEKITLETRGMRERVASLQASNYQLEETTGTKEESGRQNYYCELCNLHFEKKLSLATHLNCAAHAEERDRLNHWVPPTG